jgi:hypothetical protein
MQDEKEWYNVWPVCGTAGTCRKRLANGFDVSTENQHRFKLSIRFFLFAPFTVKKKKKPLRVLERNHLA